MTLREKTTHIYVLLIVSFNIYLNIFDICLMLSLSI